MSQSSTKRILVTGGAGFIGSHLCEHLLDRGHHVWALDNFDDFYSPARKRRNLSDAVADPNLHVVEGDMRDRVLLGGLLSDVGIDAVVHLAARPGLKSSIDNPDRCYDVNVRGTLRLLHAMQRHDARRLVFASSSSVYGEGSEAPFSEEESAGRPISPLAASKRCGELTAHSYHDLYGFSVHCLRLFTVYGPRQRPDLAIHRFARSLRSGDPLLLSGDGVSRRDYTFVSDAVRAIGLSLDRLIGSEESEYEVINVGRGEPVALEELVDRLATAMEVEPTIERRSAEPGAMSETLASGEKARELLGFVPEVGLEAGLERFVEWFRREPELPALDPSENGSPTESTLRTADSAPGTLAT